MSDADAANNAHTIRYTYGDTDWYSDSNTYSYRFSKSNTQVTPDAASPPESTVIAEEYLRGIQ
jgi:hypothetical protein